MTVKKSAFTCIIYFTGHVPDCPEEDFEDYFALGPITRYAEDLGLLLKILKQPGAPDVPFDKPVRNSKYPKTV